MSFTSCCRAEIGAGLNTSHCSGCHQTCSGLTAFDAHRDGSHAAGRFCKPPADVGLVDAGRGYPCWGFPWDGTQWWKGDDE